jgi:hypothetical protein
MNKFARFARPASFLSLAVAGSGAMAAGVATLVLLAIVAIFAIKFIRKGL